jgi:hypothetical protein
MNITQEIEFFNTLTARMSDTFARKRQNYGQTTTETFRKFGPISMLTRMHDKMGRLDNLLGRGETDLCSESIEDTLLDLANYALITILEITKHMSELKANDVHPSRENSYR